MVRSSVLKHFLTVHRKIKIFAAAPVFEIQIVLPGKFFDRCLRRYVLIGAVLEQIVERAVFCIKKLTGSHHRQEKQSETAAGDQDGADQKIVDGLASLKFHHASGDQRFVRVLFILYPTVYNGVQDDHVKSDKDRCIENVDPYRWERAEQMLINGRSIVSCNGAYQEDDDTDGTAPSAQFADRFVLMFFPDRIHDVCPFQITECRDTGEEYNDQEKRDRDEQAAEIEDEIHLRAVHDQHTEQAP